MAGRAAGLIHKRQVLVSQLWLRGNSERAIAEQIRKEASRAKSQLAGCEKTTHVTVHKDVVKCKAEWVARDGALLSERRTEQISRLLDIVRQAWVDFTKKDKALRPQYLRIALDAEDKLAKIMGTLAPIKMAGADGEPLIPASTTYIFANDTVFKPPRNGHKEAQAIKDGNGDSPE